VFTRVKELPRGALVEYQVNLHTGRPGVSSTNAELRATHGDSPRRGEVDEEDDEEELRPLYASGADETLWWESCATSSSGQGSRAMVFVSSELGESIKTRHRQRARRRR
jgi:diphthine-ammonia ligase